MTLEQTGIYDEPAPAIHIGDLGAPDEAEAELGEQLLEEQPGAPSPLSDEESGHMLGALLPYPFALAGRAYASRAPIGVRLGILEIWKMPKAEADELGERIWAAVPDRFKRPLGAVLERSPVLVAVGSLAAAVKGRQDQTEALIEHYREIVGGPDDSTPQPAPGGAQPAPGPDSRGGDRQSGPAGGPVHPSGAETAGLGLAGPLSDRAAGRRRRRWSRDPAGLGS